MGGKLGEDDKKTILAAIKEKSDWLEEHTDATAEDYEEQLAEIQGVVGVRCLVFRWPLADFSISAHLVQDVRCRGRQWRARIQPRRALSIRRLVDSVESKVRQHACFAKGHG